MLRGYFSLLLCWSGVMISFTFVGLAVIVWLIIPFSYWSISTPIFIMCLVIAWMGRWLSKAGIRISQESATERYTSDLRPFVLLLRPFSFDGIVGEESWFKQKSLASLMFGRESFEERIGGVMQNLGPTIALGRHGEILPTYGFAREYVDDSEWKKVFEDYVSRSAWIVILLYQSTTNLEYELDVIVKMKRNLNILLIPPPVRYRTINWQAGYYKFSQKLDCQPTAEGSFAALLIDHGEPEFIMIEGESSVEIQIASIQNALIPSYLS